MPLITQRQNDEAELDRNESRNRQTHSCKQRFQHTITDRTGRPKISKRIANSNNINRIHLIDIYRTFQPMRAESTLFSRGTQDMYQNGPYSGP